jgi:hypothetical protein
MFWMFVVIVVASDPSADIPAGAMPLKQEPKIALGGIPGYRNWIGSLWRSGGANEPAAIWVFRAVH